MNKNTFKTISIFLVSVFFLTLTACTHHGERRHSDHGSSNKITGYIAGKLDLDSRQETQLSEVLSNLDEKRKELAKQDELRKIFVNQLKNKYLDEEYLRRETTEFIRELESASDQFITDLGNFHASLNEEQRGKIAGLIESQRHRRHN